MDLSGQRLGNYLLEHKIGQGGMATVYRARDLSLDRYVAIKVMAPQLAFENTFVRRFLREAQVASRLAHPNIVRMYKAERYGDTYYIVMELLEGENLCQLVRRRGPLPPTEALSILRQLAAALDYAHSQGLIHRDIKSSNVVIGPEGKATLTDFGIVKAADLSQLTQMGTTLGTLQYMAPEQAAGGQVSPVSDVYSLAVVAYEIFCGQLPFPSNDPIVLYQQVLHTPPRSIRQFQPGLPAAVGAVMQRALAKDPQQRYKSGQSLFQALESSLSGCGAIVRRTPSPRPLPRPRWRAVLPQKQPLPAWIWFLAALGLVLVIVLPVALSESSSSSRRPTRQPTIESHRPTIPPPESRQFPSPTLLPPGPATLLPQPSQAPPVAATPAAELARDAANLRSGPGVEYSTVGVVRRGTVLGVIAWAYDVDGDRWLLVYAPGGGRVWISGAVVTENESATRVPRAATVPPRPVQPTAAASKKPVPSCRSKQVYVYAWKEWQDTGLYVEYADSIQVSASGQWNHGYEPEHCPYWYGPGGCAYSHQHLKAPGQYVGALLAQVDGCSIVAIGTGRSWNADCSGALRMSMNDAVGAHEDNDGKVTVRITVCP